MIFVILGTQDKPFTRLLDALENSKYANEIIAQAGFTKYESKKMKIFDYVSNIDFNKYLNEADLIITHGGVGTIMQALNLNKKVIAVARLSQYGEHHNDHQVQIVDNFADQHYILKVDDLSKIDEVIESSKDFKPDHYVSNNANFIKILKDYIGG